MVAVQQRLIGGCADLSLRRLDQSEAHIPRRILHAIKVAVDAAIGSEHHDRRGMRVLAARGIIGVMKTDRLRQCVDRLLLAGQEVPVLRGSGPAVLAGIDISFCFRQRRSIFRLEAHGHRVEILAQIERDGPHGP